MSLRTRIIIICSLIGIVVLIVIGILIYSVQHRQATVSVPSPSSTTTNIIIDSTNFASSTLPGRTTPVVTTATQVITSPEEVIKIGVRNTAKVFVERYATYSSDASLQNLRDINSMVTPNLAAYLAKSATTSAKNQPFFGVTTKVITSEITAWSETQAEVKIQAIRTEQRGEQITTSQPSGTVKLLKQGDQWLVDGIYWDK
jgi:hypothetical protein